ncbi:TetR/AcrR family transcriptional regulator [Lentimicrobium sp. S6]|uniref:TetR/AcrR family transcriptional regulator n=1 Tax=Lentimicrobium sp. S6 TaxID=2735872 RepID=UPI00155812B0|nr:TetR/AcrR family transcriptional regulator [Lentimicrobium sp. S6]NPD47297.1 TetR/AcrR family transcriptional regulator [Lentimicrobium sp. S6]
MNTRKQREIENRIKDIVCVAEELFAKYGFENVTMDQVSKAAKFSKPTLYKYFKSKDELALLVYKEIQLKKIPFMEACISDSKTGADKLYMIAMGFQKFFSQYPYALKFQLEWDYKGLKRDKVRPEVFEDVGKYFDSEMPYIEELISSGIEDGSFRTDLNYNMVLNIFYLLLRTILNQQFFMNDHEEWVYSKEVDISEAYEMFVQVFLDGLTPNSVKAN